MAARVIWSPEAADDLEQIVQFIARDSPRYGRQVAKDIFDAIDRISLFPGSARVTPELADPAIRDITVYCYRLIYRISDDAIHIASIVHGARNLLAALDTRVL